MSDIKDMFTSRWAEGQLLNADFSQLEVIVLAILSNDEQLKDDILSGKDMHVVRAAELFGIPERDVTKRQRKIAKGFAFSLQYGAGAKSMAAKNSVAVELAQQFIDNYYARYPMVEAWQKDIAEQVVNSRVPSGKYTPAGYSRGQSTIQSPTGRLYTFLEYDAPAWARTKDPRFSPTEMKNYLVQGTATADFVALFRGQVYRRMLQEDYGGCVAINTVHDSVMFDCPSLTHAKELAIMLVEEARKLPELIEKIWGMRVELPLPIDIEVGPTWGNLKKLDLSSE